MLQMTHSFYDLSCKNYFGDKCEKHSVTPDITFLLAIWKSQHQHLGISIDISVGISILPTRKLRPHRKKWFFFKLPLILPICKLTTKRDMLFVTNTQFESRKTISQFAHLTTITPERKGITRPARTANTDSEPESLLHDSIDIVRIPNQNIRLVKRSNENPTTESSDLVALTDYFHTKFDTKITNDAKVVSTEFDEKFNSYIKTVAKITNLKIINLIL